MFKIANVILRRETKFFPAQIVNFNRSNPDDYVIMQALERDPVWSKGLYFYQINKAYKSGKDVLAVVNRNKPFNTQPGNVLNLTQISNGNSYLGIDYIQSRPMQVSGEPKFSSGAGKAGLFGACITALRQGLREVRLQSYNDGFYD